MRQELQKVSDRVDLGKNFEWPGVAGRELPTLSCATVDLGEVSAARSERSDQGPPG